MALALITFLPVATAKLRKVRFKPDIGDKEESEMGWWWRFRYRNYATRKKEPFKTSTFEDNDRERLTHHFKRMEGALVYWKYRAEWNRLFHYYTLCWTLLISLLIPVLLTFVTVEGFAQMFLIIISLHSAIMLGFHRMLKVENNYKAFKYGKSEFCDLYRRMLDFPESFGDEDECDGPEEWIENYFIEAEKIRKSLRLAEIDNFPGFEDKGEVGLS